MTARPQPTRSPALGAVAPFFLAAPFGLVAAGLFLARADGSAFLAVNLPANVAVTHALVLGWLSTTMMGAAYQLGPVVIGGPLLSERLARVHAPLHVVAVVTFTASVWRWNPSAMGLTGGLVVLSFLLFALNVTGSLARASAWTVPRAAMSLAVAFVVMTIVAGFTFVGSLEHAWFPITLGRLAAHAHLGMVGWIGLLVMGLTYQLVPMFLVVQRTPPLFAKTVLPLTAISLVVFAGGMSTDPPGEVRVCLSLLLAAGPALWLVDVIRLFDHRHRGLDVHGRATLASFCFLGLALGLGLGAAVGTPLTPDDEPARWLLAYGAAALCGFAGCALTGNSYKIVPFLIWYHRYRPLLGRAPVPVVTDIYSERAANAVLTLLITATVVLVFAALAGDWALLRAGGWLLVVTGAGHFATLVHMFLPKRSSRSIRAGGERLLA